MAKPKHKPRYEMIIYWSDEDDAFIVEVPELSGCAADGRTYKAAVANAETIIKEWDVGQLRTMIATMTAARIRR